MAGPSGTLTLDTTQYETALENAKRTTASWGKTVTLQGENVSASFKRMVASFNPEKILSKANTMAAAVEHIGGASKLTAAEQKKVNAVLEEAIAKYKVLGQVAPASLQKVYKETAQTETALGRIKGVVGSLGPAIAAAFTVRAITSAVTSFIDFSSEIVDLSAKTGIGTDALQKFKFAAEQSGLSLDAVTTSVSIMQDRIGGGDKSAAAAFKRLGISIQEVQTLKPEDLVQKTLSALGKIENINEAVSLSKDIFGKAGAAMLQMAGGYDELIAKAERLGIVIGPDTIQAAEGLGDQIDVLKLQFMGLVGKGLAPLLPQMVVLAEQFMTFAAQVAPFVMGVVTGISKVFLSLAITIDAFLLSVIEAGQKIPILGKHLGVLDGAAEWLRKDLRSAVEQFAALDKATVKTGVAAVDTGNKLKRFNTKLGETAGKAKDAEKAVAELSQRLRAMNPAIPATFMDKAGLFGNGSTEFANPAALLGGAGGGATWGGFATLFGGKKPQGLTDFFEAGLGNIQPVAGGGLGAMLSQLLVTSPNVEAGATLGKQVLSGFNKEFGGKLGSTILGAFQGGGDVGKSIGGLFGGAMTEELGKTVASNLGGTLGGVFGSIIPGLGTMLGGLVGGLFGKLFGGEAKKTKQMRAQWLEQAGGLAEVRKMADYAGVSIDKLLSTKKTKTFEAEVRKLEAAFKAVQERVQKVTTDLGTMAEEGALITGDMLKRIKADWSKPEIQEAFGAFIATNLDRATQGLTTFLEKSGEIPLTAQSAEALGSALAGLFQSLQDQGKTALQAIQALSPAIDAFQKRLKDTGLGGGEAFGALQEYAAIAKDAIAGPLLDAVSGLGQGLIGLHNTGLLTQDMFAGLAGQVTAAYDKLVKQGINGEAALRLMQPTLQTLWQLQKDFGYEVDEATQKLIDQGVESGIVGDKFRSASDRMVLALESILTRFDLLLTAMGVKLPAEAAKGAKGVQDAFDRIKFPSVRVDVPEEFTGGRERAEQFAYGSGGLRDFGTGTPAILHGREAVLTEAQLRELLATRGGGTTVNISIAALDTQSVKQAVDREVIPALIDLYRGNVRGSRTATREALGVG